MFAEALWLAPGKAQGWSFYLTTGEVLFEVTVRIVAAALFGLVLGTICAVAVLAPLLVYFKASRDFLVDSTTKVVVFLIVFLLSRYALEVMIQSWYGIASHRAIYDKVLYAGQFLAFAVALCIPTSRTRVCG